MEIKVIKTDNPMNDPEVKKLLRVLESGNITSAEDKGGLDVPGIVLNIIQEIKEKGDDAIVSLTNKLDKASLTPQEIRVSEEELERAHKEIGEEFLNLIRPVIKNIAEYQTHIKIQAPPPLIKGGRRLGVRYTPIDRVAVYVPGGKAIYPSSVLMTIVPAQVAGVREIIMTSPPTGGAINPMVLALARELGITEVYRMGGAVAVAALSYGTESVQQVNKIVGPGNAFVTEAKRQLFGKVGIDSTAGPSEVLILADESASAEYIAADLMAQAEHNPGSGVLVTTCETQPEAVRQELEKQLKKLERKEAIRYALEQYCALIYTPDRDKACELANTMASEHLQIIRKDKDEILKKIRHAGAIFIGENTPVPIGDYYAGPSHVLPTSRTARFFSPLSCNDFLKSSSLIEYDKEAIIADGALAADFARLEGLTAHAAAMEIRKV